MKNKIILIFFSFCFVLSSYSQNVLLLNALFTEQDAVLLQQAEGEWYIRDLNISVSIQQAGDNFYLLKYGNGNDQSVFEAVFLKIEGEYFMDLSGILPDSLGDDDYRNSFISGHTVYKVQFSKDTLQLAGLNYSWFYDCIKKRKLSFRYEWTDHAILLSMSTGKLFSFFKNQKKEKGIFENNLTLTKIPSGARPVKELNGEKWEYKPTENISQECLPRFPFNDGWLGGDGDVSVPISKTQTIFIFSDSYVGNRNQKTRLEPGMKMVSNTVALETCMPNGEPEVHYFWNNMYGDHPQPLFRSFTNRYRYWVNDAFLYNSSLYVVLEKVAPKQGTAPDELFPFSLTGVTLAKIRNPLDPPLQWQIQLIPWTASVYPFFGIRCHAIQGKYVYFFVSSNDNNPQFLIRQHLDSIDFPGKSFEYYARNKTWKTAINVKDMDTIVNGFRANTVNYHPDQKQWMMICDIKFMDNKIKMRSAPSLTGPWSKEKIIYECPEITPGTDAYRQSNFCYLSRECIQNYEATTQTMIITYDINNSSFSEINANPKIYTPKMISISLKNNSR